jgi:hypothetical protein
MEQGHFAGVGLEVAGGGGVVAPGDAMLGAEGGPAGVGGRLVRSWALGYSLHGIISFSMERDV